MVTGVGDVVQVMRKNVKEQTKEFTNFFIFEIGNCDRPTKEYDENRAEPLEGISKFHSIWITHGGELRGKELSCENCTISDRCVQCEETVTKKGREEKI